MADFKELTKGQLASVKAVCKAPDSKLTEWERQFRDELKPRFERWEDKLHLSEKQLAVVEKIHAKLKGEAKPKPKAEPDQEPDIPAEPELGGDDEEEYL